MSKMKIFFSSLLLLVGLFYPSELTAAPNSPAKVNITPGPSYDYGAVIVGKRVYATFTLSNTGGQMATLQPITSLTGDFSFKGGSYPGAGGTCGQVLTKNKSCTVVVTFAPVVSGNTSRPLTINYTDGSKSGSDTTIVKGKGVTPANITSISTLNFGTLSIGESSTLALTFTNTGATSATVFKFAETNSPFSVAVDNCLCTLASGASCTMSYTFNPFTSGNFSHNLGVTYFNGVSTQSFFIEMLGNTPTPAQLSIMGAPTYDYGTIAIGSKSSHTFTVQNSGQSTATNLGFSLSSEHFQWKGQTCGSTLAGSSSCTFTLEFFPQVAGTQMAQLSMGYSDGSSTQGVTLGLQGRRMGPAQLVIDEGNVFSYSDTTLFGVTDHTFTLQNNGESVASGLDISVASPFSRTSGTCTGILAAGDTCTLVIRFSPLIAGNSDRTLNLIFNDGESSQSLYVNLTGKGLSLASLAFQSNDLNFGRVVLGSTATQTVTITNLGDTQGTGMSFSGLAVPFTFAGGIYPGTNGTCGSDLPAGGGSCTVTLSFSPVMAQVLNSHLALSFYNGTTTVNTSLDLYGTGVSPAALAFTDSPTYTYANTKVGATAEHTFLLRNDGQSTASHFDVTTLTGNFTFSGGSYPGTGGSCGWSLGAFQTCTITVTFAPTSVGHASSAIAINYQDGSTVRMASVGVAGTGESVSSGPLDNSFGGGKIFGFFGSGDLFIRSMVIQPDGKLVLVGYTSASSFQRFAVVRLNSDGSPDTTFGSGGFTQIALGNRDDRALGVALQSDGKILLAGYSFNGRNKDFALARINVDGTLDTTFNSGRGFSIREIAGGDDLAYGVAVNAEGSIVLTGSTFIDVDDDFAVVHYSSSGEFLSFTSLDFGDGDDRAYALAVQPDGKVVTVGYVTTASGQLSMAAVRFNSGGDYDFAVSNDDFGIPVLGVAESFASSVKIDGEGNFILNGFGSDGTQNNAIIMKLTSAGNLATDFGTGGLVVLQTVGIGSFGTAVTLQDGRIVMAGYVQTSDATAQFLTTRLTSAGALDGSYGDGGVLTTSIQSNANDRAYSVLVQPDGKIVAAGNTQQVDGRTGYAAIRVNP